MDNTAVKSLKLPSFDGEHKSFQVWWTRFMAYAGVFGFAKALREGGESIMPRTDETAIDIATAPGRAKEAAKKRNVIAMAQHDHGLHL